MAEEAVDPDDIETLQDLIVAAVNEAMRQVDEASSQSMGKLAGGLGGSLVVLAEAFRSDGFLQQNSKSID